MKRLAYVLSICILMVSASCGSEGDKEAAADKSSAVCIWDKVSLIDKPQKNGKWLSSVSLGEKLTYLKETEEETLKDKKVTYAKVKLADGKEGWIRSDYIAVGATGAVIAEKTDIYTRPELSTLTKKYFEAMDIIAVKSTQGEWTEVIGKRSAGKWIETAWIRSTNISSEEKDIAMALFITRALVKPRQEDRIAELNKITEISDLKGSVFEKNLTALISESEQEEVPSINEEITTNLPDSVE